MLPEVLLKLRIESHIALVIEDEVVLHLCPLRQLDISIIQCVSIRPNASFRSTKAVLPLDSLQRKGRFILLPEFRCRMCPIRFASFPFLAQAFFIAVAVLGDDGFYPFRMPERQTHPHRCTIVKDIHRKMIQTDSFHKSIHHMGQIVERIGLTLSGKALRLPKRGHVRSNQMILIGQFRYQVPEHVACRRETV